MKRARNAGQSKSSKAATNALTDPSIDVGEVSLGLVFVVPVTDIRKFTATRGDCVNLGKTK